MEKWFERVLGNAAIFSLGMAVGGGSYFVALVLTVCWMIMGFKNNKKG